jgi:hypothetical protein
MRLSSSEVLGAFVMRSRLTFAALALSLAVGACGKDSTTAPNSATDKQTPPTDARKNVKQPLIFPADEVLPASVVPATAGTIYRLTSIQVTHFARNTDPATASQYKLVVDGLFTFTNTVTGATSTERFTNAPANLTSSGAPTAAVCDILHLDIGAIHLNLLGLVVDLAPVHLAITAVSGAGNLLGNLLCAVTHLLDGNGLGAAITNLLNSINALLMQLL